MAGCFEDVMDTTGCAVSGVFSGKEEVEEDFTKEPARRIPGVAVVVGGVAEDKEWRRRVSTPCGGAGGVSTALTSLLPCFRSGPST